MVTVPEFLMPILKRIAEREGFLNFTSDIESSTNIGDYFSSELFGAVISGRQKQKNGEVIDTKLRLLCKLAPANAQRRKEFITDAFFGRETYFYNTVAPAFIRFQQEKGLADEDQFKAFPKFYDAIHDTENEIYAIVMQDMRPDGFAMWPKQKPSPVSHCQLFLREVAKLHAISFAMKDQQPEQFKKFEIDLEDLLHKVIHYPNKVEIFSACFDRAIELLDDEEHKNILREIQSDIPGYITLCYGKKAADRFGIVTHGDAWNNNLIFRENKELGTVEDICFVDWQGIRYASPATDLLYNLCSSTDKKTRDEELENFFHEYHEQLSKNIRKMGSDPDKLFPYEAFQEELKLSGIVGFLFAPMIIEISLAEAKDVSNLDEICDGLASGDGEQKLDLIQGLSGSAQLLYKKRINECIRDLVKYGYFQKLKN